MTPQDKAKNASQRYSQITPDAWQDAYEKGMTVSSQKQNIINTQPDEKYKTVAKTQLTNNAVHLTTPFQQYYEQRFAARPDLVTADNLEHIKNRMSTLSIKRMSDFARAAQTYTGSTPSWVPQDSDSQDIYKSARFGPAAAYIDQAFSDGNLSGLSSEIKRIGQTRANGWYTPETHQVVYNDYKMMNPWDYGYRSIMNHEISHSFSLPFLQQVANVKKDYPQFNDPYLDSDNEIYSRKMQAVMEYGIDPSKEFTGQDYDRIMNKMETARESYGGKQEAYDSAGFGIFNRYPKQMVLDLFNKVALNKNKPVTQDSRFNANNINFNIQDNTRLV